jgi:hypothetical protein
MEETEAVFRQAEEDENKKAIAFANSPNIASVDSEIGIVRNCLHTLIKDNPAGRPSTIKDLANAVGSLVRLRQTLLREQNELVDRSALTQFIKDVVMTVADTLESRVPEFETIMDELMVKLEDLLTKLQNQENRGTKNVSS